MTACPQWHTISLKLRGHLRGLIYVRSANDTATPAPSLSTQVRVAIFERICTAFSTETVITISPGPEQRRQNCYQAFHPGQPYEIRSTEERLAK